MEKQEMPEGAQSFDLGVVLSVVTSKFLCDEFSQIKDIIGFLIGKESIGDTEAYVYQEKAKDTILEQHPDLGLERVFVPTFNGSEEENLKAVREFVEQKKKILGVDKLALLPIALFKAKKDGMAR